MQHEPGSLWRRIKVPLTIALSVMYSVSTVRVMTNMYSVGTVRVMANMYSVDTVRVMTNMYSVGTVRVTVGDCLATKMGRMRRPG